MKVTIVGGGFGGVKAALELIKDKKNHVTLISDRSDFQYYPALYSTATGHSKRVSWVPLGQIFANYDNIDVVIDTIVKLDANEKILTAESGATFHYKTLILAIGAVTTFFGIEGLDTFAYGIKSAEEVKKLREHLYDEMGREHIVDKHYVIVGAGPTGVELAASLGHYLKRLKKHYGIKKGKIIIDLVEAAPRVMPRMSEYESDLIAARLTKLGVKIMTNRKVESENAEGLVVNGKVIESQTVIWTSGVANHPFFKQHADIFTFAPNGKVIVDDHLKAHDSIYVIGDNAATPHSGLAQTALHDALFVAGNLRRIAKFKSPKKYKSVMPPVVIPVGKNWALMSWKKIVIAGWAGSMIRRFADFVGYSDILPVGQALGVLSAERLLEDQYFSAEMQARQK